MSIVDPDLTGHLGSVGSRIRFDVTGAGDVTILLLPTWTVAHKRLWKAQVPYLSRHFRVVTYDGPGNGGSDRPPDPSAYDHHVQVGHALAVLDATSTHRAVVVGLSQGCAWALQLAAEHADRVLGAILIAPSIAITDGHAARSSKEDPATLPPSRVPVLDRDPEEHWAKYDPDYWRDQYEDFLWFFFGMCFPEPHSTKQVEDCVAWGLDTTPDVLAIENKAARPSRGTAEDWCRRTTCPVLTIHGDQDRISPLSRSERIAELTNGRLIVLEGAGHIPPARDPIKVNLLIRDFVREQVAR